MRSMTRRATAIAAVTVAVAALSVGTAQAVKSDSWAGCPDGAVCIYPQNQNPAVSPTDVFYSYGAHNLSGKVGNHWVLNNQTGGATANLCTGYNGAGCGGAIAASTGVYADLGPIYSIRLNRP